MTINKLYCINLDSRTDRWEQSKQEFNRLGISVERFPAVSGPNPHLAFNHSQRNCIQAGYDSGEECFLVLEDDCQFDAPWSKVEEAMKDLPFGWESLYLGCNLTTEGFKHPERVSNRLVRLRDCWMSHAIIYSRKGAENILGRFNVGGEGWYIFDEWIRQNVLPEGNSYLIAPMVCYQRPSKSDIWGVQADYSSVHIQGNRIIQMI